MNKERENALVTRKKNVLGYSCINGITTGWQLASNLLSPREVCKRENG